MADKDEAKAADENPALEGADDNPVPRDLYDTAPLAGGEQHEIAQRSTPRNQVPAAEVGPVGSQVYGEIGVLTHIVDSGRTTVCGRTLDDTSPTVRLSRPLPGAMLCGTCVGRVLRA